MNCLINTRTGEIYKVLKIGKKQNLPVKKKLFSKFDTIQIYITCGNHVSHTGDEESTFFQVLAERLLEYTEINQENITEKTKGILHKSLDDGIEYLRKVIKIKNDQGK